MSDLGRALMKLSGPQEELVEEQESADNPGFKPLVKLEDTSKEAMIDELKKLNSWPKLAEEPATTRSEAQQALTRLKGLEKSKPTAGQLGRGAALGAVAGPTAGVVSNLISGGFKGKGLIGTGRTIAGQAASGAIFGGGVPWARHAMERQVEMEKLKDYLGESKGGKLRRKIKKTVGV